MESADGAREIHRMPWLPGLAVAVEEPKACNVGGLEVHKAISPHCPGSFEQGKFTLFLRIAAKSKLTTGERQTERCSRETALTSASLQMKNECTSVAQYAVGQVSLMR
jgi:hypothetical protein